MLVVISSNLLLVDVVVLWLRPNGFTFWIFLALGVLGTAGTFTAAWFLHEGFLMLASIGVLVGLFLTALLPTAPATSHVEL